MGRDRTTLEELLSTLTAASGPSDVRAASLAERITEMLTRSHTIARFLAVVVSIIGVMVMAGWVLEIEILKRILPQWVTMKFTTAFSFLLSGVTLYFISKIVEGNRALAQLVIPITTLTTLTLMLTLLASSVLGVRTGVEDLFVKESQGAIKTSSPGRPSIGTMACFILLGTAGVLAILIPKQLAAKLPFIGLPVLLLGALAIVGYLVDVPALYYTHTKVSTAMAFHTAILFVLLGVGLLLAARQSRDTQSSDSVEAN